MNDVRPYSLRFRLAHAGDPSCEPCRWGGKAHEEIVKGKSPEARSTELLKAEGKAVCKVTYWIRQANVTKDAFGFGDLLVVGDGIWLIQCTAGGNGPARKAKILGLPAAKRWLADGGRIEVHDWRQYVVQRGMKLKRYKVVREEVTLEDFGK